ncbi:aminotransferase class IV [Brevibacterium zhoupengii]|uniref:aminotransferase class IV n=1 Tax=Brevibacterium zhoupengii TaxID=2898795 RepID=UPI0021D43EB5|nr:aminotransferase class IV [Brevibacterium zhoupengii]
MSSWTWNPLEKVLEPCENSGTNWAADSWLVNDGTVRALNEHRQRFTEAARELGFPDAGSDDFWSALINLIPRSGQWFPRVEIIGNDDPILGFRLRPAPVRTDELSVWVPPFTDPRQRPRTKGPDIALLGELRTRAYEEHRCDEVLLVDEQGLAVESATSSLLWWEGETLCVPHPDLAQLPGITSALIVAEARRRAIGIEYRRARPEDLFEHEVWLVNALHGIGRIRAWSRPLDSDSATAPGWFWEWKKWLNAQVEPI